MKDSIEDLLMQIAHNLKDLMSEYSSNVAKHSYNAVPLDPPHYGVRVSTIDAREIGRTREIGVTVRVSADESFLTAEFFGVAASAGPWEIPEAAEFPMDSDDKLLKICEEIFKPLSRS